MLCVCVCGGGRGGGVKINLINLCDRQQQILPPPPPPHLWGPSSEEELEEEEEEEGRRWEETLGGPAVSQCSPCSRCWMSTRPSAQPEHLGVGASPVALHAHPFPGCSALNSPVLTEPRQLWWTENPVGDEALKGKRPGSEASRPKVHLSKL